MNVVVFLFFNSTPSLSTSISNVERVPTFFSISKFNENIAFSLKSILPTIIPFLTNSTLAFNCES